MMDSGLERRKVRRVHFNWPVWFAEDFHDILFMGQMRDVSSGGLSFSCPANEVHLYPGQALTVRFSVPHFSPDDCMEVRNFIRSGRVRKIAHLGNQLTRISVEFFESLPFDPVEAACGHPELLHQAQPVSV